MYCMQVGECRTLHVLSLRENELTELPENLGQLEELTVLDVVGNRSEQPDTLSLVYLVYDVYVLQFP